VNTIQFPALHPDRIASGSDDLTVCIVDWKEDTEVCSFLPGHELNIFSVVFNRMNSEHSMYSCAADGSLCESMFAPGRVVSTMWPAHSGPCYGIEVMENHRVVTWGEDGRVQCFDQREGNRKFCTLIDTRKSFGLTTRVRDAH